MISEEDYKKAQHIVRSYENERFLRLTNGYKGKYQFLWFDKYGKDHTTYVSAPNISIACDKFYEKLPITLSSIDYEVQLDDNYIDISENKKLNEFI